jgi:hypothetical protein
MSPFCNRPQRRINWLVSLASNANNVMTIDPNQLPRRVEIDVPERVMEWVRQKAAETGRDPDELLLELLDRAMQQE